MAIEAFVYLTAAEAVKFHVLYMRRVGETRFGVFDKSLIESALVRPQQAATYENADLIRQAATLLLCLIKNHPWTGGNKRTATFLTNLFLKRNGYKIVAPTSELIELCLQIESDALKVDEIENWLRNRVVKIV
ncbi:MAG TPA: type II toxin-antitoxin system death-on-curing family toxin [Pyrinomonadaceae bacterium]|nr:type II toxin-antitoxin system death-on-curing family toxin [Pyrinomonadaceae bacterium]